MNKQQTKILKQAFSIMGKLSAKKQKALIGKEAYRKERQRRARLGGLKTQELRRKMKK